MVAFFIGNPPFYNYRSLKVKRRKTKKIVGIYLKYKGNIRTVPYATYAMLRLHFLKTPQKEEIDIIHAHNSHLLPVEVKIKEKIGRDDVKALFKFLEKNNLKRALLITLNTERRFQKDRHIVEAIPYWRYWTIGTRIRT